MKKFGLYILAASFVVFLGSCVQNNDTIFTGSAAELDAATWNANAVGVTYPIFTRIPPFGRAVTSFAPDSILRRFSGTVMIRVNMVGPQSSKDETVGYKIFGSPLVSPLDSLVIPATVTGQTPAQVSGKVKVLDGLSGIHYASLNGKVTIPAKSSFGFISVSVLNSGSNPDSRFLGIQLDSTGSIKPSPNYNKIGLVIDQR
jgi:hypothetical protein